MKLLVFAHTPPPHHGQSYMVQLMLEGFGGDRRMLAPEPAPEAEIECYHVNCRYSENLEDIGSFRLEKMWLVLRYCLEAVWCRFRFGVRAFYYVPAPGKRAALYRDWAVMLLCRPFFRDFIHHWHAVGLGDWLCSEGTWFERWLTHWLLGEGSLDVALAIPSMRDALWFRTRHAEIVANGIPDPCPDFDTALLPRRNARLAARRRLLAGETAGSESADGSKDAQIFRVLFLAHCTREKGLFDAIDGVVYANKLLQVRNCALRLQLTVAGSFPEAAEEAEFRERMAQNDLAKTVTYVGFAGDEQKRALLAANDVLCFPTYYHAESFGLVVVEAMAAGLAIVTTRWRAIPDLLPADYAGFVAPRSPAEVAAALIRIADEDGVRLRELFLTHYTLTQYVENLRAAISTVSHRS